ncbi:MAG: phosphotransferase [Firmicutes bacterium]|nr:phosphotransferase [Bacillota bacterium]
MFEELTKKYHYTKIEKGWSNDEKYLITTNNNEHLLLRISDAALYQKKKYQFEMLQVLKTKNISCSQPIEFGHLKDGRVYTILSYLEGEDAQIIIPTLSQSQQYNLGREAGSTLQVIHSIPSFKSATDWEERMDRKLEKKMNDLVLFNIDLPYKDLIIHYVNSNRALYKNRKQVFQHGDYHVGNMIIHDGKIGIIDFDKIDSGDPYEEFKCFVWNVYTSTYFMTGMIDGYFDDNVPDDFFPLLKFYVAESLLGHIVWAKKFGEEEIKVAYKALEDIMMWYDYFKLEIPTWYNK